VRYYLLACDVVHSSTFRRNVLSPSSGSNVFEVRSSETSASFCRTTRRYIPEDGILHSHRFGNLKPNNGARLFVGFLATLSVTGALGYKLEGRGIESR
jgi:hypothetical protein